MEIEYDNDNLLDLKGHETDFIKYIDISHLNGFCSARFYIYKDDADSSYLENVYVNPDQRGTGFGNKLMFAAESLARLSNSKELYLLCDTSSWVYDWYTRRGYEHYSTDIVNENYKWLVKKIQ